MPFDAGVMYAVVSQLKESAVGSRIEKVYQPERDEIVLLLRSKNGSRKLLLSASAGCSRVGYINAGQRKSRGSADVLYAAPQALNRRIYNRSKADRI